MQGKASGQQVIQLKGGAPILPTASGSSATPAPASTIRAKSTLKGVKIAIPSGGIAKGASVTLAGKVVQNRVILPHGESLKTDADTKSSISAMNSAYEAFLNQKTDRRSGGSHVSASVQEATTDPLESAVPAAQAAPFEPSGVRPRKPCNCTKSQCLKL